MSESIKWHEAAKGVIEKLSFDGQNVRRTTIETIALSIACELISFREMILENKE